MSEPRIVYFSSVTENTKIFVEQLGIPAERLPLRRVDEELSVDYPYVLFVPTYGGGRGESAIPPQVKSFMRTREHRELCLGVVGGGNINFGDKYAVAADMVARKLGIPVLARFELRGTQSDLDKIREGIHKNWETLMNLRGLS